MLREQRALLQNRVVGLEDQLVPQSLAQVCDDSLLFVVLLVDFVLPVDFQVLSDSCGIIGE